MRVIAIILLLLTHFFAEAQYLTTSGKKIINHQGDEIILRGMGLGGWMLQEGYMLETSSFANPQHEIEAIIEDLIGEEKTEEFYSAWLANHCTKADIDSLASWGFNSVRLPMHYKLFTPPIQEEPVAGEITWIDTGFEMVDQVLEWCESNEMYLILDLHAAPGGQGRDAAISDYDTSKPSLWESDENKAKTVALWRRLAARYSDEVWMGGYDLINETNWNFTGENENGCDETTNTPLKQLYEDIVEAIREVDKNHIIYIEGNCWANNHAGIWPPWDDNLVLSFHKYWSYNNMGSIQGYINMRDEHTIPLWMGEAGENSNTWFKNAINLLEENDIGWAWWPMKKIGSVVNPLTVEKTEGYQVLLDYWSGEGECPSEEFAFNALMEMTENLKIENNTFRKDVIDAMFRQLNDDTSIPFKTQSIPGTLNLTDFDLGRNGVAYFDNDTANYRVSSGTYTAWNAGWSYRNDGIDIEVIDDSDPKSNGYNVGWTSDREWMQYTVNVAQDGVYDVITRYASEGQSALRFATDIRNLSGSISLNSTGGYQKWENYTLNDIVLYQGTYKLKVLIDQGGMNLSYLDFSLVNQISDIEFEIIDAFTSESGDHIFLNVNKRFDTNNDLSELDFDLKIDGVSTEIAGLQYAEIDDSLIELIIGDKFNDQSELRLSYSGSGLIANDGTQITAFSDLEVTNNLLFHFHIPTKIEAEDFATNVGLVAEETTDVGGGQNMGFTNNGDFLEYRIVVENAEEYLVTARVACLNNPGSLRIQQLNSEKEVLNEVNLEVPITGGWQEWVSVSTILDMDEDIGYLKVIITDPEFNLNWLEFTSTALNSKQSINEFQVFPNPLTGNQLTLSSATSGYSFRLTDLSGKSVFQEKLHGEQVIHLSSQTHPGVYIWLLVKKDSVIKKGKLIIK